MPAVKVPMFTLRDETEICQTIIKGVMVDVVNFHKGGSFCKESVHSDGISFAVTDSPGTDIN